MRSPAPLLFLLAPLVFAADPAYTPPAVAATRAGALLPWNRVVTYYGNPLSKKMGILGELPPAEMMAGLEREAEAWRKADPATGVKPGLELVATVAAGIPGPDGLYRWRMPDTLIKTVIGWARAKGWLVILDVQAGQAPLRDEVARLRPFLEDPDVHLALDPEFNMQAGTVPGRRIGTMNARDVNAAIALLASLVEKNKLPPKLLIVHRFTEAMVTGAAAVRPDPRVQVVMVMDGFGPPALKRMSYRIAIQREPVQFAGIKLFYKNDRPMMTPKEALTLTPGPSVVIYQ